MIASEANVAERVAHEREAQGLSYEGLAKRMTEQGCAMQGSAIFRIEKGEPRRHVNVDELVTFAKVFDTTVEDLLAPMELVRKERARELAVRTRTVWEALPVAVAQLAEVIAEGTRLAHADPELYEFFQHQWVKESAELRSVLLPDGVGEKLNEFVGIVIAATVGMVDAERAG